MQTQLEKPRTVKSVDWSDLAILNRVAEAGSIGAAANDLGVHYSTVMRRVERFQRENNVRMFRKSPTGLEVTEEATAIVARIGAIARSIREIEHSLSALETPHAGSLTLTMPKAMLEDLVMPGLAELLHNHPGLTLNVLASNELLSVGGAADLAVRVLRGAPEEHLVARPLGHYCIAPYATAAYLETHEPGNSPQNCRLIGGPGSATDSEERLLAREILPDVPYASRIEDLGLQMSAVRQNLGLALLPCFLGDADPALIRLPGTTPSRCRNIWLVTHPELARLPLIRLCMDHIAATVRSQAALLEGRWRAEPKHGTPSQPR